MRMFLAIVLLLAIAAGAAFVTKPGPAEFDAELRELLMDRVARSDLGEADSDMETLALVGCKFSPSECFNAVRAVMDVQFQDKVLFTLAEVRRPEKSTCIGAFGQFWCGDPKF